MNRRIKKYRATLGGKYRAILLCAKGRGIKVDFNKDQFKDWWSTQQQECSYCELPGDKVHVFKSHFGNTNRFTIDRKDKNKHYLLDNIALACSVCNRVKGNIFTYETMKIIGKKFVQPIWKDTLLDLIKENKELKAKFTF